MRKIAENCETTAVPQPNLPKPQGATPLRRFLPDKAIDLMDEAGSCLRLAHSKRSAPSTEMQKLQTQLAQLRQEKAKDLHAHDFEHAAIVRAQIEELEKEVRGMTGAEPNSALRSGTG